MWNGQRKTQSVKLVSDTSFLRREVYWTSSPSMGTGFWNMILPWKPCLLRMISTALQLDFTRFASTLAFNLWGSWMCFFPGNRNSPLPPDFFPTWIQRAGGFSTQNRVFGFQQKAGNVYPWPENVGFTKFGFNYPMIFGGAIIYGVRDDVFSSKWGSVQNPGILINPRVVKKLSIWRSTFVYPHEN